MTDKIIKPRVFVSSVIEGFEVYREATGKGIIEAGGEPVLVEDYPGLPVSPRNACLDGVAGSDIYVVVIGSRGGWTAPSGILVVEEEFEEARKQKLPIICFIQNSNHDEAAKSLIRKISDYVNGFFRLTFDTPDELKSSVEKSLQPIIENYRIPKMESSIIQGKVENPDELYGTVSLRIVFAPERDSEIIDPIYIESSDFIDELYKIGHSPQVKLFSYRYAKNHEVDVNEIVVTQSDEHGHLSIFKRVKLEITTKGLISVDINMTGERPDKEDYGLTSFMAVTEEDIIEGLKRVFNFSESFYSSRDPFMRFDKLLYNASITGIENKILIPKPVKKNSITMGLMHVKTLIAFDKPRPITRGDLRTFDKEIETVLTMFRRRWKNA